jgi:hypothetical protein
MIKPGSLPNDLAETFSGGAYKEIILSTDTTFYRGGISSRPLGQFLDMSNLWGTSNTRRKALLPKWPNGSISPLDSYHEIQIPQEQKSMLVKWDAKQTSILVALNKYWFLHRGRYLVLKFSVVEV